MNLKRHYTKVILTEHEVIKEGPSKLMKIEYEKTINAYRIFEASNVINIPKVLYFNEQEGKLKFVRIKNVSNVERFQNKSFNNITTASNIGTCLANVHVSYFLPDDLIIQLPMELEDLNSQQVFIHGDLTGDNILIDNTNKKIFIIDWMMTRKHQGKATFGTAYFDLAWFLNYQFYSAINLNYFRREIEKEAYAFLKSYISNINYNFDIPEFRKYLINFVNYKINLRRKTLSYYTFLLLLPSHKRFLRFAKRLAL